MNRTVYLLSLLFIFILGTPFSRAQDSLKVKLIEDTSSQNPIDSLRHDSLATNAHGKPSMQNGAKFSSIDTSKIKKPKEAFDRQLRLLIDIAHPISGLINKNQYDYEFYLDYNIKKDVFLAFEAGYGGGKVNYDNLKYKSSNTFIKFGIERSFFDPLYKGDWDMVVIGVRYCAGLGQRGDADFTLPNPFGGSTTATVPAKNFFSHWGELSMGLRFELLPRFFIGWNGRMRFNFSANAFDGQVAPNYLAGFGKGDKATSFGFNYYMGYAIRWRK